MVLCINKLFGCLLNMVCKDLNKYLKICLLILKFCERCGEFKRFLFKYVCLFDIERCFYCNKEFRIKNFDSY